MTPLWLALTLFQGPAQAPAVAWVGLYDAELVAGLENRNRLAELCPAGAVDMAACYRGALTPTTRAWPVHERPDPDSPELGQVMVVSEPGRGLTALWIAAGQSEPRAFVPDIFDDDWGYGYNFHQTFHQRSGEWFQLPAGPFPVPAWIRLGAVPEDRIRTVSVGAIMSLDAGGWVVLEVDADGLVMRREQEADMWCDVDPPAIRPDAGRRFTRASLLDSRGHLRLRPRYPRGC